MNKLESCMKKLKRYHKSFNRIAWVCLGLGWVMMVFVNFGMPFGIMATPLFLAALLFFVLSLLWRHVKSK